MLIRCYHISRQKNRTSILKNGLIPSGKTEGRIKYKPRIFLSTSINHLGYDYVDFENVDCWEFEVEEELLKRDEFSGNEFHFYIEEKVGPGELRLLANL